MVRNKLPLVAAAGFFLAVVAARTPGRETPPLGTFELREYVAADGRLNELHDRFRATTLRLHEKHGITTVAAFTAADGQDPVLRMILAYPDGPQRARAWEAFVLDPEWQRVRRASDARGRLVEAIREYPLTPTADCPAAVGSPPAGAWLFELQMLPASAGGADRVGTADRVLGCWTTPDPAAPDGTTLVRLIARRPPTAVARQAFFRGPDAAPPVEPARPRGKSLLVVPTDYSPLK